MNIKEMSVAELKAIGFDMRNQIDNAQQNLNVIQQELVRREQLPKEEKKK